MMMKTSQSLFKQAARAAVLLPVLASTAVLAEQQMSSEEILRRFEIQQAVEGIPPAGGATRGLRLDYGTDTVAAPSNRTLESEPDVTPSVTLDPYIPPTATYTEESSQPVSSQEAPQTVALDSYQPVVDEARIDLRIYFEWNSASLKPEAIGQLSELCSAINQVVGARAFKIIGHTDKSGAPEYNLYLSQARAREVKRHLVEECAISPDSLYAVGEGERQADPDAPSRNPSERRVEVQLVS